MQGGFINMLIGVLLGLVMMLGDVAGIDTTSIEVAAKLSGITPVSIQEVIDQFTGTGQLAYDPSSGIASDGSSTLGLFAESDDSEDLGTLEDWESPWTGAETAAQAAEAAGVGTFAALEDFDIGLNNASALYFYQDGLVEGMYFNDTSFLTINKAVYEGANDISNDDREYTVEWTEDIDGIQVQCFGMEEGAINKALFTNGGYVCSIVTEGYEDAYSFVLDADGLASIVAALV